GPFLCVRSAGFKRRRYGAATARQAQVRSREARARVRRGVFCRPSWHRGAGDPGGLCNWPGRHRGEAARFHLPARCPNPELVEAQTPAAAGIRDRGIQAGKPDIPIARGRLLRGARAAVRRARARRLHIDAEAGGVRSHAAAGINGLSVQRPADWKDVALGRRRHRGGHEDASLAQAAARRRDRLYRMDTRGTPASLGVCRLEGRQTRARSGEGGDARGNRGARKEASVTRADTATIEILKFSKESRWHGGCSSVWQLRSSTIPMDGTPPPLRREARFASPLATLEQLRHDRNGVAE